MPAAMLVQGFDVTPRVGSFVEPDLWRMGEPLVVSDWDQAPFRIPTSMRAEGAFLPTPSGFVEVAVNVEVTGRTVRRRPNRYGLWVRARITFIGDGEPDQVTGGWLLASN